MAWYCRNSQPHANNIWLNLGTFSVDLGVEFESYKQLAGECSACRMQRHDLLLERSVAPFPFPFPKPAESPRFWQSSLVSRAVRSFFLCNPCSKMIDFKGNCFGLQRGFVKLEEQTFSFTNCCLFLQLGVPATCSFSQIITYSSPETNCMPLKLVQNKMQVVRFCTGNWPSSHEETTFQDWERKSPHLSLSLSLASIIHQPPKRIWPTKTASRSKK